MRDANNPKASLLVAVAAVALATVVLACPLSMMAHAEMSQMMGQDMPTQGMQGMCPMLCGVPPYSIGFESSDLDRGPLPVYLDPNPTSTIRPIFHPPNLI
jgi:hypothetical protein